MKKNSLVQLLSMLFCSMVYFSCDTTPTVIEQDNEQEVALRSSEPFLDYLAGPYFQTDLASFGIERLKNDHLNLEVIDYNIVIQTDPFDPIEVDIDPADSDPPNIIIRVYSKGTGSIPAGVYFLDLDNGNLYDILGNLVMTIPPWG